MTPEHFIRESNWIEGINRDPTTAEIIEYQLFLPLEQITIHDMMVFVAIYEPNAKLRDQVGMDVRVGNHVAPGGGLEIRDSLQTLLTKANNYSEDAYQIHLAYENLHPFTDCNGRSGRMLWMWQMQFAPLGFLHTFYYQALAAQASRASKEEKKQ